ncbi:MAG: MxaD family protein [Conexibacter sp.]|nr:MxaD family protein [Conexibacter sp.]
MRRSIRVERRLHASPEAVFAIIADHARYDRFDGIRRSRLVRSGDPAPNGLGAVRWIWIGPLRFEEEVTAFEPARRLDYVIRDVRPLPFRHEGASIRLAPDGPGTHAVWTTSFDIPIPIVGSTIDRIFSHRLERGFGHVLDRSAELSIEAAPASP